MSNVHEEFAREIEGEIERLKIVLDYHRSKIPTPAVAAQLPKVATTAKPVNPALANVELKVVQPRAMIIHAAEPRHMLAKRLMAAHGKPMTTTELVEHARKDGVSFDNIRPNGITAAFFTAMDRHPELFDRREGGVWSLKEWVKNSDTSSK